jgi:epoxyqueuosine reductase QueG
MMKREIEAAVGSVLPAGMHAVGYADLEGLVSGKYSGYPRGVCLMRALEHDVIDGIWDGPTRAYFDQYHAVNAELAEAAAKVAALLEARGFCAQAVPPTFHDAELDGGYAKDLRTALSHKMLATRSGLGWIGKTDLLVSRSFGPRIRLASVLTDAPLPVCASPVTESECGSCELCVSACPGNAASGMAWKVGIDRDEYFDPHKCMETCRMFSRLRLGEVISLCGICLCVCPRGKRAKA